MLVKNFAKTYMATIQFIYRQIGVGYTLNVITKDRFLFVKAQPYIAFWVGLYALAFLVAYLSTALKVTTKKSSNPDSYRDSIPYANFNLIYILLAVRLTRAIILVKCLLFVGDLA
jgi:hypothetical protein